MCASEGEIIHALIRGRTLHGQETKAFVGQRVVMAAHRTGTPPRGSTGRVTVVDNLMLTVEWDPPHTDAGSPYSVFRYDSAFSQRLAVIDASD